MQRYPLIAYLDPATANKVREIQTNLSEKTGSRGCLEAWEPHLSLGSEVQLEGSALDEYVRDLKGVAAQFEPFSVSIQGFGFIDNWSGGKLPGNTPYGVYLKVIVSEQLQHLVTALRPVVEARKLYFEMPWPYRPHIAVAYKDLTQEGYVIAKQLYEQAVFDAQTNIDGFSLAKHDNAFDTNTRFIDIALG